MAVVFDVAEPVEPVGPERPDRASGKDTEYETALPVRPELVALDWALVSPESPVSAAGLAVTDAEPPGPPLAEPVATLEPPTTMDDLTTSTVPPGPAVTTSNPPSPPTPANASVPTRLMASPVKPE